MNNNNVLLVEEKETPISELGSIEIVKEAPMSRELRRKIERIEANATKTVMMIGEKFQSFLVQSDTITDESINEKMELFDKQWRFYCRMNNLKESAFPVVSKHLQLILDEFNKPQ